jgi:hypothetical protein
MRCARNSDADAVHARACDSHIMKCHVHTMGQSRQFYFAAYPCVRQQVKHIARQSFVFAITVPCYAAGSDAPPQQQAYRGGSQRDLRLCLGEGCAR